MKIELNAREITALGKTIGGLLITAATVLTMLGLRPCSPGPAAERSALEQAERIRHHRQDPNQAPAIGGDLVRILGHRE